ncbi:hypothetical protein MMC11_005487 [Xylographa trunciseda]|nr:hypothetical protein [Xylographa trunciseda]
MQSIAKALHIDSASRKARNARKAAAASEKTREKALDAQMKDILAQGQFYEALGDDSTPAKTLERRKQEFYNRRSLIYAEEMMKLRKRRIVKRVAHVAALATALGGSIAATVGSHGVLAPTLALPGVVLTWALADSAVERRKRKTLREEWRQPAPCALQLYLEKRKGEDEDEDEDEEDEEELGGVAASYKM